MTGFLDFGGSYERAILYTGRRDEKALYRVEPRDEEFFWPAWPQESAFPSENRQQAASMPGLASAVPGLGHFLRGMHFLESTPALNTHTANWADPYLPVNGERRG